MGACLSIRKDFTVERVDALGAGSTGTGGATGGAIDRGPAGTSGSGTGGTVDGDTGTIDREPNGTIDGPDLNEGNGVTGVED